MPSRSAGCQSNTGGALPALVGLRLEGDERAYDALRSARASMIYRSTQARDKDVPCAHLINSGIKGLMGDKGDALVHRVFCE